MERNAFFYCVAHSNLVFFSLELVSISTNPIKFMRKLKTKHVCKFVFFYVRILSKSEVKYHPPSLNTRIHVILFFIRKKTGKKKNLSLISTVVLNLIQRRDENSTLQNRGKIIIII